MKISRKNKSTALFALFIALTTNAIADTLYISDNTRIYIAKNKQRHYGYYIGTSSEGYLSENATGKFTCSFFFIQTNKSDWPATIKSWEAPTPLRYATLFVAGSLYKKDNTSFSISFQETPPGCRSKPDGRSLVRQTNTIDNNQPIYEDEQGLKLSNIKEIRIDSLTILGETYQATKPNRTFLTKYSVAALIRKGKNTSIIAPIDEAGIHPEVEIPTRILTTTFK